MNNNIVRNIFLLLASTLTIMAGATLAPALPGMKNAFIQEKNADLWVKLILTVPGLFIAISAPFIGWIVDKWNKKNTLIIALIIYGTFGTAGYFLNYSLQIILLGRIFLGFAVAGIMVTGTTIAGDFFEGKELSKFMGLQAAFGSFGGVIFMGLGGILAEITWFTPFLIYLLSFLILPGIIFTLKETSKIIKPPKKTNGRVLIRKRSLLTCYSMGFLEVLVLYFILLHFPFYATEFGIESGSQIGFCISFMLLIIAIISINFKHFDGKTSYENLQAFGFILVGFGYIIMGFASYFWVVLIGMIIAAVGFGITRPNLIIWMFSFTNTKDRGKVIGGITTVFFLSQFLSPILTQPLVSSFGFRNLFLVGGVLCILSALGLNLLKRIAFPNRRIWA